MTFRPDSPSIANGGPSPNHNNNALPDSFTGSKASNRAYSVRFTPDHDRCTDIPDRQPRAKRRHSVGESWEVWRICDTRGPRSTVAVMTIATPRKGLRFYHSRMLDENKAPLLSW
jgi:hypothetical protein